MAGRLSRDESAVLVAMCSVGGLLCCAGAGLAMTWLRRRAQRQAEERRRAAEVARATHGGDVPAARGLPLSDGLDTAPLPPKEFAEYNPLPFGSAIKPSRLTEAPEAPVYEAQVATQVARGGTVQGLPMSATPGPGRSRGRGAGESPLMMMTQPGLVSVVCTNCGTGGQLPLSLHGAAGPPVRRQPEVIALP
eukprot:TRINITY_DN66390_c0_g1_i1.p1 TRINITY_DN66390_c0_g1~~TRINITY_DN66390_c0_g1_i1.p1  ORF type:complete len:217 (+),score=67.01 TRINITY_DN66390_c0_g1_i1:76-651(+)